MGPGPGPKIVGASRQKITSHFEVISGLGPGPGPGPVMGPDSGLRPDCRYFQISRIMDYSRGCRPLVTARGWEFEVLGGWGIGEYWLGSPFGEPFLATPKNIIRCFHPNYDI